MTSHPTSSTISPNPRMERRCIHGRGANVYMRLGIMTVWIGCYSKVISIKFISAFSLFRFRASDFTLETVQFSRGRLMKVCWFSALNRKSQVVNRVIMEADLIEPSAIAMDSCFTAFDKDWWVLSRLVSFIQFLSRAKKFALFCERKTFLVNLFVKSFGRSAIYRECVHATARWHILKESRTRERKNGSSDFINICFQQQTFVNVLSGNLTTWW